MVALDVSWLSISFTILMNIYDNKFAMIARMLVASFTRCSFRLADERMLTND